MNANCGNSELNLPSNQKFGGFLSFILFVGFIYLLINNYNLTACIFAFLTLLFSFITYFKASMLLELNKAWMRLGLFLGYVVSPLVLGIIFFLMFTPIALLIRLGGRDELRLQFVRKRSYWIKRNSINASNSLKYQF